MNDHHYSPSSVTENRSQRVTVARPVHGRLALALIATVTMLMPTACAYKGLNMGEQTGFALHGNGTLAAANSGSPAITYDPALAPIGGQLKASLTPSGDSTDAEFSASGLQPNRGYSVIAHVNGCGGVPGGEGPHFQNRIDPAAKPTLASGATGSVSTDSAYVNSTNEIWLDVRTDSSGSGSSHATVPFLLTDRGPGSIVVHGAEQTAGGPGKVGVDSDRVACLTLSATPKGAES